MLTGLAARVVEGWQVTAWAQRLGHPPPPRVARSTCATRCALPRSARRSSAPGAASRRRVRGRRAPRPRSSGRGRCARTCAAGAAPLPEARAASRCTRSAPRRRCTCARGRASLRAGERPGARTGDELDAPVRATYRVARRRSPRRARSPTATNWTVAADHPLAAGARAAAPDAARARPSAARRPVDAAALRQPAARGGRAAPPAADEVRRRRRARPRRAGQRASPAPLRATWHRPVPGALGALAGDGDADPAARVVVALNPALPAGRRRRAHAREPRSPPPSALSAGPRPGGLRAGRPDVEIRLRDLRPAGRAAAAGLRAAGPALADRRAARRMTPIVAGDAEPRPRAARASTLEGFHLDGDLRARHRPGRRRADAPDDEPRRPAATVQVAPGAWGSASRPRALPARRDPRRPRRAADRRSTDCIVDGAGRALRVCGGDPAPARRPTPSRGARAFAPALRADGVTFAGARARSRPLDAVDCLFPDGVEVVQQQEGCLRHCYLGPDAVDAAGAPDDVPLRAVPAADVRLDRLRGRRLLRARARAGPSAAVRRRATAARSAPTTTPGARRASRLRRRIHEFVPLGLRPGLALAPWEE